ncbi:hypothetical protein HPC49_00695 [Pyxidicoccus fallax]|uniref:Lipoprotein n=1 Tax=Pyxidicoccus fallax TaxID=394095 RepID=A0A848LG84_9BACT|nr:hypothetical protein [Pyxidicoccus fallax]NMO14838.1 hypothetical protein [Pyxidicoccus fallax]NPC76771.1 hypothetical protein [Pyxidicoccus fallax]
MRFDVSPLWLGLGVLFLACGPGRGDEPCDAACPEGDVACRERSCADTTDEAARAAKDCSEMPAGGRCLGTRVVEWCELGVFLREDCEPGATCVEEGGVARCAEGTACVEGVTRCSGGGWELCTDGRWQSRECAAGCVEANGRGWCGEPGSTLSGIVRYARRGPDAAFRGWTPEAELVPAGGFLVASYRDESLVDLGVTDAEGRFTVRVPDGVAEEDRIVVYAAGRGSGTTVTYAVADPALSGEHRVPAVPGASARIWSWSRSRRSLVERPVFTIHESEGSGAAAVFDALRVAWRQSRERYGRTGLPVVAWLGFGTTWSCGACFSATPVTAAGRRWEAQVWLPGDTDAAWWSEAMVLHELGHWVMSSHGTTPNEGGPHYIGVPTFPGQAWSEGWATWFSADSRGSSRYYDRQGGTMFWVDLEARKPSLGMWSRPKPGEGLLQRIEENEVAAILYRLGRGTASRQPLYEALAAPAMNASPWARGYLRHRWRMENGKVVDVRETEDPAPCLADFLDALMCQGFPRSVMDAATEPAVAYPYPSHAPLCR